jgi:carbonic anhydrase
MSTVLDEVIAANEAYMTAFGNRGALPMPPGRRFAILTCMDARIIRPSSRFRRRRCPCDPQCRRPCQR